MGMTRAEDDMRQPMMSDEQFASYQEYFDATTPLIVCPYCGRIITEGYCDNDQCGGEE